MSDSDSLFGSDSEHNDHSQPSPPRLPTKALQEPIASIQVPPELSRAGFYLFRDLVPDHLQRDILHAVNHSPHCSFDPQNGLDQAMLWGQQAQDLVQPLWDHLRLSLKDALASDTHEHLFEDPEHTLQIILNAYSPGQGITPHVDLPNRYGPAILGISFISPAVMHFEKEDTLHAVLLQPGDVYVLSKDARHFWTHGIPARQSDQVSLRD